jgi:hypothetical protein
MTTRLSEFGRNLRLNDIPAIMLLIVAAFSGYEGAKVLRGGQQHLLAFGIAVGMQGTAYLIEKSIIANLSTLRPEKNLLRLIICFLPFFVGAAYLNVVLFFHLNEALITKDNTAAAAAIRWTAERSKINTFHGDAKTQLLSADARLQTELRSANAEIAAAKASKIEYSTAKRDGLRAESNTIKKLLAQAGSIPTLPITAPADADGALTLAYRAIDDLHAALPGNMRANVLLPHPTGVTPVATDTQSVLWRETQVRTARAMVSWAAGFFFESLPFLALWGGIPTLPLDQRIRRRKAQLIAIFDAIWAPSPRPDRIKALPFYVEPLQIRGSLEMCSDSHVYSIRDLSAPLAQLETALSHSTGRAIQIAATLTYKGQVIDPDAPLAEQLAGDPLRIRVRDGQN